MLRVSDKVDQMAEGPTKARALDHLYQGQSNDCYWHGLFGGIYIVHMRMATLNHLIAAEDVADQAAAASGAAEPFGARLADTDLDAIDEVIVASSGQTVVVDTGERRRHLVMGPAGQPRRPGFCHAPPPRGVPRTHGCCRPSRGGGGDRGSAGRRACRRGRDPLRLPRSTTS